MSYAPVLYVEDEENDAFFMQRAFSKLSPSTPLQWVNDGQKAIAYLAGQPPYADRVQCPLPCAILLDLNLGLVSGFEVLEWLRGQPAFQSLPVVVFSSSNDPDDKRKALHLGASDYLPKPASGTSFPDAVAVFNQRWMKTEQGPLSPTPASNLQASANACGPA